MFERIGTFGTHVHVSAFQMLISGKQSTSALHSHSQGSKLNLHIEGTSSPAESRTSPALFKTMQAWSAPA